MKTTSHVQNSYPNEDSPTATVLPVFMPSAIAVRHLEFLNESGPGKCVVLMNSYPNDILTFAQCFPWTSHLLSLCVTWSFWMYRRKRVLSYQLVAAVNISNGVGMQQ